MSKKFVPGTGPKTPYDEAIKKFAERTGTVQKERDSWRMVALSCLLMLLASIAGWYYVSTLPKAVPHVIQVSDWGEAKYVGPIGSNQYSIERSEASINYYIKHWMKNIRSVSIDNYINAQNLEIAYNFITENAANLLTQDLLENNPIKRSLFELRRIFFESVIKVTKDSWQVDWIEKLYTPEGKENGKKRYRGILTLYLTNPTSEQMKKNSLGIFIDSYEFVEIERSK